MAHNIKIAHWIDLKEDAQKIRYQVFVVEQNVPVALEWDEMDIVSLHAVAYDSINQAIATGRLLPDGHIGRMAVLAPARHKGVGAAVLNALIDAARKRGDGCVMLNAQVQVASFYSRYGFFSDGVVYQEAGILHQPMRYIFK